MKKLTLYLAALLAAILLCFPLASCDMNEGIDPDQKEQLFKDLKIEDTFEDGKPYHLYFLSLGNGTCSVEFVTTDPDCTEDFVIEIPETSPTGETVVEVDFHLSPSKRIWDNTEHATEQLPLVLPAQDMEIICSAMQQNGIKAFDLNKFQAYYLKIALGKLNEINKQEAIENFPLAQLGDIYVFDLNASAAEQQKILGYLTRYYGWNAEKKAEYDAKLLELAKLCPGLEQAEACLSILRYMGTEHVTGLRLPKTVTVVGSDMWQYLDQLESITVDENNPTVKMIDNCLVDTATGTLLRCLGDGRVVDQAGIKVIGSYAFTGCELKLGEGGVKEGIHLYIPEGVTTLQKDCFDGMIIEDMMVFTIHLPMTLETFESPDELEEIFVYTYAGTMQEWEERVSFADVSEDDCYVYVKASDQSTFKQYFIPKSQK